MAGTSTRTTAHRLTGALVGGPCHCGASASSRAQAAFPYDAFVGLRWPLELIFQFAVALGQLPGHLSCSPHGIAIEEDRLQRNGLTELEFVRAFSILHRLLNASASVIAAHSRVRRSLEAHAAARSGHARSPSLKVGLSRNHSWICSLTRGSCPPSNAPTWTRDE